MPDLFQEALAHQKAGQLEQAIPAYYQLLEETETADIYANLGVALRSQGKTDAAIALYRKALQLDPYHPSALSNLGGALRTSGCLDEALLVLQTTIQQAPQLAAGHFNLGLTLMDLGQPEAAIPYFDHASTLEPHRTDAPIEKARALLKAGRLQEGFALYEQRLTTISHLKRSFKQPAWDGSPLNGKTLLLYAEQGFGDSLQFIRYVSQIAVDSGQIVLECPPELKRLFQTVPGIDQVITTGDTYPPFDVHASLFSLPFLFKTSLETIPHPVPYLTIPKTGWHAFKVFPYTKLKVGIVWASGFQNFGLHNRSIGLKPFLRLLDLPGVTFYSLQKGAAAQELKQSGCDGIIHDLGPLLKDFSDTAQAIGELDLLISADTAIIHLAGALGKPVWTVLPAVSEWRWLLNRSDSPWYPTMRLFHQSVSNDWEPVFTQVRQQLSGLLAERNECQSNKTLPV